MRKKHPKPILNRVQNGTFQALISYNATTATAPGAQLLTLTSSSTLTGHAASGVRSAQATSPFGLNATKATAPGAQLLTLTCSSTLHSPRCLRSQISPGYIAIRLKRHQGHSARSPYYLHGRALPNSLPDELFQAAPLDELFQAAPLDELFPTTLLDEPLLFT